MKLKPNNFLRGLREGIPQIGIWASINHPAATEIIAPAGYDWVVIDMEHAPTSEETAYTQLQALASQPGAAFVRPPWNDQVMIKRVLDIGAQGLVIPYVQSVEEAKAAAAATRYPPSGIRGVGGTTRATAYGRISDYLERVEGETALILQIETRKAMTQAVDIGQTEGVDGVFFGPADIAADLGYLGQPLSTPVWDAIMPVAEQLMKAGVKVGTLVLDPDFAVKLFSRGFSFIACAQDAQLLARAADSTASRIKAGLGRD